MDRLQTKTRNGGIRQGLEQGIEQGEERLNSLILCLIADGRLEEIEKAAQDKEYRAQLYKEIRL